MTRILIDWGGRGTVVVARTHLEVDGARIHLPDGRLEHIDGPTVIDLDPTDPGDAWRIRHYPEHRTPFTWWVLIPEADDDAPPIPVTTLARIDPATLSPTTGPNPAAWTAALNTERAARAAAVADLRDALADLPAPSASVSHIAVTDGGRLAHRAGGSTTLTTTTSGRLAVVRAPGGTHG
ncbi:hypothetical protein HMPREF0569_0505 [Micrococcus luteus SK58]|uniref:hypothetical protein n=1 Tax=Micrococcus luteus TaxID=1270 RepID=UPI0001C50240|nr:hypothetical protein [Micrococcus luteus]EFD50779.1 hypothetical protein HMPREF0569_0505 [Micrococcus luteus SK58]